MVVPIDEVVQCSIFFIVELVVVLIMVNVMGSGRVKVVPNIVIIWNRGHCCHESLHRLPHVVCGLIICIFLDCFFTSIVLNDAVHVLREDDGGLIVASLCRWV